MTLVGVLVLLTLAGGLGRIGSLGQAFSGPRLPAAAVPTPSGGAHPHARSPLLPAQLGSAPAASAAPAHARRSAGPSSGRSASGAGSVPSGGPFAHTGPGSGPGSPGTAPGASPGSGNGSGSSSPSPLQTPPPPTVAPRPTLISGLADPAAAAAARLPAPVGPPTAHTIEAVGSTAAQVAPLPPPAPLQAHAPVVAPVQPGGLNPAQVAAVASIQ